MRKTKVKNFREGRVRRTFAERGPTLRGLACRLPRVRIVRRACFTRRPSPSNVLRERRRVGFYGGDPSDPPRSRRHQTPDTRHQSLPTHAVVTVPSVKVPQKTSPPTFDEKDRPFLKPRGQEKYLIVWRISLDGRDGRKPLFPKHGR